MKESRAPAIASDSAASHATPPSVGQAPGWRGKASRALLPIGMIIFALSLPYIIAGDGADRYAELQALLQHGALSSGKYSLIGPFFATPLLYLLGAFTGNPAIGAALYNVTIFFTGLLIMRRLLRPWLEERTLRAFLLLLLVGSMFPFSVATFYGETFTAVLVAAGLLAAVLARHAGRLPGWIAVTLGVANSPASLVALAFALAGRLWQTRRWRYLLVGVAAATLILGENLLRRGSPFATGYAGDHGPVTILPFSGQPGFSYPFLLGLLAIFFSFGKGLIFYAPGLFLPMRQRLRAAGPLGQVYALWLLFTAGLIAVYASWWAWEGGMFWGPRFLLIATIPASLALALWTQRPSTRLWVNLIVLGVFVLSLWVGLDSMVFGTQDLGACVANNYHLFPLCDFTPEYSALWRPLANLYLIGFNPRWVTVEIKWPPTLLFAAFTLFAGPYIAWPLLRAIGRQIRALLPAPASLLAGWRW